MSLFSGYDKINESKSDDALSISGGTMTGEINMDRYDIRGLASPLVYDDEACSVLHVKNNTIGKDHLLLSEMFEFIYSALSLNSEHYPSDSSTGHPRGMVITSNEGFTSKSVLKLESLIFDDDTANPYNSVGNTIRIKLKYVNSGESQLNTILLLDLDTQKAERIKISKTIILKINKSIKLDSIITNPNIYAFVITLTLLHGTVVGNESSIIGCVCETV